jgi:hypothetical protein
MINTSGRIVVAGQRYKVLVIPRMRYNFQEALAASAVEVFGI